jgi:hypothetical protein
MNQNFGFDFIINFSMDTFQIKPPLSYGQLIEISKERFDLTQITEFFFDEEEISIRNESEYLKLLDIGDRSEMKEIELIIKCNDQKKQRKQSLRKISNSFKSMQNVDIHEIYDYDNGTVNGIINSIFKTVNFYLFIFSNHIR